MDRPVGKKLNLTRTTQERLGIEIVSGEFRDAGAIPVEAELCERYGVSRSIMREAVKMLTAKGLLASRPKHGTWVQPESEWNLLDPDVLRWLLTREVSVQLLIEFKN